jgi:hypothetical protein
MVVYSVGKKNRFFFTKSYSQVVNLEIEQKNVKKNNLAPKVVFTVSVHCIQFLVENLY